MILHRKLSFESDVAQVVRRQISGSRSQPSSEIRGWIHSQEKRLLELESRLKEGGGLTKLLADQQVRTVTISASEISEKVGVGGCFPDIILFKLSVKCTNCL